MMWRLLVLAAVVRYGSSQVYYPGFGGDDSCPWWYCENGGTCWPGEDGNQDTCECPYGYSGQNCETRDCSTVFITTWDQSAPVSGNNDGVLGLYIRQADTYEGRDVYKKFDADVWLFYMSEDWNWVAGQSVGSYPVRMEARNSATYPDQTEGRFFLWSADGWVKEPNLEIRCSVDPPCDSVLCQNGGDCITHDNYWDSEPFYTCACVMGFNGAHCENNVIDECASNPCFNGATCVDGADSFTCECIFGSMGTHCERVLPYFREQFLQYEVNPTAAPIECFVCDASDGHCDVDQSTLSEEFRNNTNTTQACSSGACWIVRTAVSDHLVSYQRSCEYNSLECDDIFALENCQEDAEGTKVCYRCCAASECNFGLLTGEAVFVLPDSGGAVYIASQWLMMMIAALSVIVNG
ncbi:uncharacterized protein LOC144883324 [Branchiostoma floridae x Branchiostoma japonicum]